MKKCGHLNLRLKVSTRTRRPQPLPEGLNFSHLQVSFCYWPLLLPFIIVRSNQSINIYHPNTSQSQNLLVLRQQNRNYVPKCTKWPLAFRDKSYYTFNSNNFTELKAGNVRPFIWEGNSILWFLEHACKYPEMW